MPPDAQTLPTNSSDFKKRIHRWLHEHIGEPVGPNGKHLPIPAIREIQTYPCSECSLKATHRLEGWLADGSWIEVPLCYDHQEAAAKFLKHRKKQLTKGDTAKRARKGS